MSDLMKNVYYNPADPGSLRGKERLKQGVLQEYGIALKDKDVTDWLAAQDAYTLHRTAPVKYKRNRVVVYGKDVQFQADLVDMSAHSKENDNIKFLLTCIDVFSQYAWACPLKNKTGKEVTKAFDSILKENRVPQKLQTDKGTEFFNKHFQQLMKKYNIHHFATASDVKASVIERFNRTLRDRSSRFLTAVNSKRYYDILQDLIDGYNASYHKSIKMRPLDVHKENEADVFNNLYGRMSKDVPPFRYKIGDVVRVPKVRNVFSKGYEQNYTEEFFTIAACVPRNPPVYRLQDYDGDIIDGCFYEKELQKIIVNQDKTFKIEKILDRKKRGKQMLCLVKWRGWPPKFSSWLPERDILDIQNPLK